MPQSRRRDRSRAAAPVAAILAVAGRELDWRLASTASVPPTAYRGTADGPAFTGRADLVRGITSSPGAVSALIADHPLLGESRPSAALHHAERRSGSTQHARTHRPQARNHLPACPRCRRTNCCLGSCLALDTNLSAPEAGLASAVAALRRVRAASPHNARAPPVGADRLRIGRLTSPPGRRRRFGGNIRPQIFSKCLRRSGYSRPASNIR